MRKLAIIIGLMMLGIGAKAQFITPIATPAWYHKFKVDQLFWLGTSDTTEYSAATYPGALAFQQIEGDTAIYYSNGAKWIPVGSTQDLSGYALKDSVYLRHYIDSVLAKRIPLNPDTIRVNDSIWLNGKWVKGVSSDSTLGDGADNVLPTQGAVKRYSYNKKQTDSLINKFQFNFIGLGGSDPVFTGSDWYQNLRELGNVIDLDTSIAILFSGYTGSYNENNVYAGIAFSEDDGNTFSNAYKLVPGASEDPFLIKHDNKFYLYVEDKQDVPFHGIRLYLSTDLKNWTDEGIVLDTISQHWDSVDVSSPTIIIKDDTWYMYYEGRNATDNHVGSIGLATSSDGITWTRYSTNPIITGIDLGGNNSTVTWAKGLIPDDVVKVGSVYYMTAHANRPNDNYFEAAILYSYDLIRWTDLNKSNVSAEHTGDKNGNGIMMKYINNKYTFYYIDRTSSMLYKGYPQLYTQNGWQENINRDNTIDNSWTINKNWLFKGDSTVFAGRINVGNVSGKTAAWGPGIVLSQSSFKAMLGLKYSSVDPFLSFNAIPTYGTDSWSQQFKTHPSMLLWMNKTDGNMYLYYVPAGRANASSFNSFWGSGKAIATIDSTNKLYVSKSDIIFSAATFSGDGTGTSFNVTISPGFTPSKIIITPTSADAAAAQFYVDKSTITSTQFTAKAVGTTPPSGTNNITFDYELIK